MQRSHRFTWGLHLYFYMGYTYGTFVTRCNPKYISWKQKCIILRFTCFWCRILSQNIIYHRFNAWIYFYLIMYTIITYFRIFVCRDDNNSLDESSHAYFSSNVACFPISSNHDFSSWTNLTSLTSFSSKRYATSVSWFMVTIFKWFHWIPTTF